MTVAATSITIDKLPERKRKNLPRYPLPALRIARLAVATSAAGQGIGKRLLRAAFQLSHEMAERVGCVGVVVDAKPHAISYYQRYGFETLEVISGNLETRPVTVPLFLPLGSIPRQ